MRKKVIFPPKICERCGDEYIPGSWTQKYCCTCGKERDRERKLEWWKKKNPNSKPKQRCQEPCCICGGKFACHIDGKAYCNKHYLKMKIWGDVLDHHRSNTNEYAFDGDVLFITTSNGKVIKADKADYEMLRRYSWCVSKTGYAVANIGGKVTKLHRYILNILDQNSVVDHKNNNPLDNRRCNLRICTQVENSKNNRGRKNRILPLGVSLTKSGKYRARIMSNRKEIRLGIYPTLEEAVKARREGELKYCGDFAAHKYLELTEI